MRGEQELRCLDFVKMALFYKDGQPIRNPLTCKTYIEASDDEFKNERNLFVNSECCKSYFGLLDNDRAEIENVLRIAKANPASSLFPDFVFDNGFIEHFQVTSSSVTRKGATHTRKEKEFYHKVATEAKEIKSKWDETPSCGNVRSKSWMFSNPTHCYNFFVESFKRNWNHHLDSYKKYTGSKEIGIFMIEYPEIALSMCEDIYHDWIDGMSQGDMREQEKFQEYRLSRDKNLLKYIHKFKDYIKYVIYVNSQRFEIIRIENIPYIIKLLPWDYVINSLQVYHWSSLYSSSAQVYPNEQNEADND